MKGPAMKDLKPYVLPLSLAAVQWIATTLLRVDRVFFTYDHVTPWMIATKVLYFLFLAVAWCFLFAAVRNIRDNKAGWRRGAQVFALYWPITLIFQILLWPGTWSWDDIFTLERISTYESWDPWQHILTGAYDTVLLNVLPFPGGLIFLQNILVSICVAFVVTKLESTFRLPKIPLWPVDTLVKVLPFLLPPVLTYPEVELETGPRYEKGFTLSRGDDGAYVLSGGEVDKLLDSTDPNNEVSMRRFQQMLIKTGMIAALREAGAKEGDTIKLGEWEFDFVE